MSSKPSNVIPLSLTADFFAERANRSLDRYNYSKALRYFKRAGEIEPQNPLHFCNMAGVLGHLGKFHESNEILHQVLQRTDEEAAECHYYLACNYIYLDLLEQAEEHALKYLRKDPKGRYVNDAVELLEYVAAEFDRPLEETEMLHPEDDEKTLLHEEARALMEKGSFQQAEKILLKLIKEYPDFLAASNNLSLCYYYKGEVEKSRKTISTVLLQDPCNIHALCNLAILYYQQQEEENLQTLLMELRKIIPLQYDQAYKLGITLGVMGEHRAAYQLFKKMSAYAWQLDFHLYHYCAVAAYNLGRYKEARKYWRLVQREDPQSPVAPFYLEQIQQNEILKEIPYYYHVPGHQKTKSNSKFSKSSLQEEMERDPFIRSSFLWALRHGDRETKLQVLQAFEWLGDQEVIEALKEFVEQPEQEEELKQMARFVLKTLGHATTQGSEGWRRSWTQVLEELNPNLTVEEQLKARELWVQFIQQASPNVPPIRKPASWAAALEYMILPKEECDLAEIAARYGVTSKTVKKHVEVLQQIQG